MLFGSDKNHCLLLDNMLDRNCYYSGAGISSRDVEQLDAYKVNMKC